MWRKVKENFDSGVDKVRWFSSLLNERMKVEISVFSLLYKSAEMEKKKAEMMRTIGERVFALRGEPEKTVLRDPVIIETLGELEKLNAEIEEIRKKASEIERIET
ncbi:MAG: hypothetical protein M1497_10720 [Nitrospirae bacterium]|nr:hypothetical protein [Nitrospirota bacterium]